MKTPVQAANDLLHVMTEVGQSDCYLEDMRLIISALNEQQSQLRTLADALKLVNNVIYAAGAPLGSDNYFTIREVCCKAIKEMEVGNE